MIHIGARSHSVQEAWGSQHNLYRGQMLSQKPYQKVPLVIFMNVLNVI